MDEDYRILLDNPKNRSLKGERNISVLIDEGNDLIRTALAQGVDIGLTRDNRLAFRGVDGTNVDDWLPNKRTAWERLVSANRVALRCALEASSEPRFDTKVPKK